MRIYGGNVSILVGAANWRHENQTMNLCKAQVHKICYALCMSMQRALFSYVLAVASTHINPPVLCTHGSRNAGYWTSARLF